MKLKRILFSSLLLAASFGVAHAAVQSAETAIGSTGATSAQVSLSGVGAGDGLLVVVDSGFQSTNMVLSSITDSQSQSLTQEVAFTFEGNLILGEWYLQNANAGSHTITVTLTANFQNWNLWLIDIPAVSTFDKASTWNDGYSTTPTSNSVTPTNSGEFALTFYVSSGLPTGGTWTSGYTSGATGGDGWAYDTSVSAATAPSYTASGGNQGWLMITSLLVAAAATPGIVISNGHVLISNGHPVAIL